MVHFSTHLVRHCLKINSGMEQSNPNTCPPESQGGSQKLASSGLPKLDTLPNELIFKIFKNLNPVHATCAGLTCKKLWAVRNKPQLRQPSKLRLFLNYIHADLVKYWEYCAATIDYGISWKNHETNPSFWPEDLQISDALDETGFLRNLLRDWMDKAGYFYDEEKLKFVSHAEREELKWERGKFRGIMLILGDELRLFMCKDISTGTNSYHEGALQIHGIDFYHGNVFAQGVNEFT